MVRGVNEQPRAEAIKLPVQVRLRSFFQSSRLSAWEGHRGLFCPPGELCDFLLGVSSSGLRARHAISGISPSLRRHRITLVSRLLTNVSDKEHLCKRGSGAQYPWAA